MILPTNKAAPNERNHPKWQQTSKRTVYKGRVEIVEHDVILPDGSAAKYEVDHSERGAVAVLIKTSENAIILSYQYRFPLDRWIYDLPGGGVGIDESLEEAAVRECQEEVGVAPNSLVKLVKFYPNPGRSDWPVTVFYCDDYSQSSNRVIDAAEVVEKIAMPMTKLEAMITAGEILDPSLLIAWHTAKIKKYLAQSFNIPRNNQF